MKLADKLRCLRDIEGSLRGLNRPLTQGELVRALRDELGESLSQSYLSQIESGKLHPGMRLPATPPASCLPAFSKCTPATSSTTLMVTTQNSFPMPACTKIVLIAGSLAGLSASAAATHHSAVPF